MNLQYQSIVIILVWFVLLKHPLHLQLVWLVYCSCLVDHHKGVLHQDFHRILEEKIATKKSGKEREILISINLTRVLFNERWHGIIGQKNEQNIDNRLKTNNNHFVQVPWVSRYIFFKLLTPFIWSFYSFAFRAQHFYHHVVQKNISIQKIQCFRLSFWTNNTKWSIYFEYQFVLRV